jgi:hypothetical protein
LVVDRPKDEQGRFISPNPEPLADKALSVRLPISIDALIRTLPSDQRADWLRRVLCEAAQRELMGEGRSAETTSELDESRQGKPPNQPTISTSK